MHRKIAKEDSDEEERVFWDCMTAEDVQEDLKNPDSNFFKKNIQKIRLIQNTQRSQKVNLNKFSAKVLGLEGINPEIFEDIKKFEQK